FLDSRAGMQQGGESGPAVVPHRVDESLIVEALRYESFEMPPKQRLPEEIVNNFVKWIEMGAPDPRDGEVPKSPEVAFDLSAAREFWAFQPPRKHTPPAPESRWAKCEIDQFVEHELHAQGLGPSPQADRRTLIRRWSYDLTGLPPSVEEVEAFVIDESPDAFEKVVDRMLASQQYGEHWGRHWLDVARYADSNGGDINLTFHNAWRYRNYVVNAFNSDKPFDEFVREQLAGDLMEASDPAQQAEQLIASGYLVIGPKMLSERDKEKLMMDVVDEQLDSIGRTFLGLTLGCARCHDHKFDPIPTADYYALAGILKSTKTMENLGVVAAWHEYTLLPAEEQQRVAEIDKQLTGFDNRLKQLKQDRIKLEKQVKQEAEKAKTEGETSGAAPAESPDEAEDAEQTPAVRLKNLQLEIKQLNQTRKELEATRPEVPKAMGVGEGPVQNVKIHLRGSHLSLGREEPRHFLQLASHVRQPLPGENSSGRLELARWLTDPAHPLTSRVIVNRAWQWHFGAGIVRTPDNFGRLGERPTNQPLLDWLASELMRQNWSLKQLHRLMLTSSSWQMSTTYNPAAAEADPENLLLWRMNRRRMEAEEVRDSLLALGGSLGREMHGQLLDAKHRAYVAGTGSKTWTYDFARRSVYLPVLRSSVYEMFQAFDFADPSVLNGRRATTTVTPQALFMMNSKFIMNNTEDFAESILHETHLDGPAKVNQIYERVYGRSASQKETASALAYLELYQRELAALELTAEQKTLRTWQSLCRVLISSNEFLFVD
ncbi:MAG: DUF1553 domain-containing protein, partial [Planctomycetaceae bacterium]|nr:DUF1553 domain-containing protein [Planctomycetaceae bacterium]